VGTGVLGKGIKFLIDIMVMITDRDRDRLGLGLRVGLLLGAWFW